jgi:hypothetical protein
LLPLATIECPWCGERFETAVDPEEAGASYIEDCQVCCAPILIQVSADDEDGERAPSLRVERG